MEIITDIPNEQVETSGLRERLENVFSRIFVQPPEESEFKSLISESGELRIEDICKVASVLEITDNTDAIKEAICNSKSLRMCSESIVKSSAARPDQNTLILREIATSTPSGAILQIFMDAVCADGTPCPAAQSVRSDMNDTWFVTFQSEADAKNALTAIRKRVFNGKPVLARLKTESTHKSFYSAPNSATVSGKGPGSFSPHSRGDGKSPLPSPSLGAPSQQQQQQQSPQQSQGSFFGVYPVPPPPQFLPGNNAGHGGPPNAYAGMIGADGKASFSPHQHAMYGAVPPHMQPQQPGYGHPQMGGFPIQQQQGQYNQYPQGRRYNNNNFNNRRNAAGFAGNGNFQNGGQRNQRSFNSQQQQQQLQQGAAPSATATAVVAPESGAAGDSPRSGSGTASTTADGSSSQDSTAAASATAPVTVTAQAPQSVSASPVLTGQQPHSATVPKPSSMPQGQGQGQMMMPNFPNYMHPAGGAPFFPGYPYGAMPGPFGAFPNAPGMGHLMNPMGFPSPQGFYPPMNPMNQMNVPSHHGMHPGQRMPHQHSPRGGGTRNSNNTQFQHQQQQYQQQQYQHRNHNQGSHAMGQGYPRGGPRVGAAVPHPPATSAAATTTATTPESGATTSTVTAMAIGSSTSAPAANVSSEDKAVVKTGGRERKNEKGGDGKKGSPSSDAAEAAGTSSGGGGARRGKDSGSSISPDNGATRKGGNATTAGASAAKKGGERNGADRKKSSRESKGRDGNKDDSKPAPRRTAEFNMEADFPILIDSEVTTEKQTGASSAAKKPTFDYANAVRKATQTAYDANATADVGGPAPVAVAANKNRTPRSVAAGKKVLDTNTSDTNASASEDQSSTATSRPVSAPAPAGPCAAAEAVKALPSESMLDNHHQQPPKETSSKSRDVRAPSDPPVVESFTFGSVVAPVVNAIDRSGFHFGVDGVPVRVSAAVPALTAATSTTTSTASTVSAGVSATPTLVPSSSAASTTTAPVVVEMTEKKVTSAVPEPEPNRTSDQPSLDDGMKPTAAWGAKKSFADILLHSNKA